MLNDAAHTFSLADVKTGGHVIFQSIFAGRAVASRLTALGFTPGAEIEMNQNYGHGPLVVIVRGARVALGRQEAKNIIVQEEPS